MIIPKEHVKEPELSNEAKEELVNLKSHYLDHNYEYILESVIKRKSIPAHHHLHLIITHDHFGHDGIIKNEPQPDVPVTFWLFQAYNTVYGKSHRKKLCFTTWVFG